MNDDDTQDDDDAPQCDECGKMSTHDEGSVVGMEWICTRCQEWPDGGSA